MGCDRPSVRLPIDNIHTLHQQVEMGNGLAPFVLSWVAQQYGLQLTMWMLLAAPIALLIGLNGKFDHKQS